MIYDEDGAAEALGIERKLLERFCEERRITHSDLGPGEDYHEVWHEHLYRWTPETLEIARTEIAAMTSQE